jgi:hypothetical protein
MRRLNSNPPRLTMVSESDEAVSQRRMSQSRSRSEATFPRRWMAVTAAARRVGSGDWTSNRVATPRKRRRSGARARG